MQPRSSIFNFIMMDGTSSCCSTLFGTIIWMSFLFLGGFHASISIEVHMIVHVCVRACGYEWVKRKCVSLRMASSHFYRYYEFGDNQTSPLMVVLSSVTVSKEEKVIFIWCHVLSFSNDKMSLWCQLFYIALSHFVRLQTLNEWLKRIRTREMMSSQTVLK